MGKLGEILRKILDCIVNLLLKIYNNPLAREMAMNALNVAANEFADVAEHIAARVKEAANLPLTSKEKYDYVVDNTVDVFKDVPGSILNQLIENALAVLKEKSATVHTENEK